MCTSNFFWTWRLLNSVLWIILSIIQLLQYFHSGSKYLYVFRTTLHLCTCNRQNPKTSQCTGNWNCLHHIKSSAPNASHTLYITKRRRRRRSIPAVAVTMSPDHGEIGLPQACATCGHKTAANGQEDGRPSTTIVKYAEATCTRFKVEDWVTVLVPVQWFIYWIRTCVIGHEFCSCYEIQTLILYVWKKCSISFL